MNNFTSFLNLLNSGALWSIVHTGLPTTIMSKVICHGYDITLALLAAFDVWFLCSRKFNKTTFAIFFGICFVIGSGQYIYLLSLDRVYPAWVYFPWTTLFNSNGVMLNFEDWLFTPLCTVLFYFACIEIMKSTKRDFRNASAIKIAIIAANVALMAFFSQYTAAAGALFAYTNMLPGIVMSAIVFEKWSAKVYFKLAAFMTLFAFTWDFIATYLIHQFMPACCWWAYISSDSTGVYHHSKVFLDISSHKWAWILNTLPVEITPWITISSIPLVYFLLLTIQKIRKVQ